LPLTQEVHRVKRVLVPLETVRTNLGDDAAKRLLDVVDPVPQPLAEGARRYVRGVQGDRVRRLRDRAAFASIMVRLVEQDEDLRKRVLSYIDKLQSTRDRAVARPRRAATARRAKRR
jgi:hypothetical protein